VAFTRKTEATDPQVAMFPTTKRSTPTFTQRNPAAAARVKLPACRAWRIIAAPAVQFGATGTGPVSGKVQQAPAGAVDGAYPVWVQPTDPEGRELMVPVPLYVDGPGWRYSPMGPGWSIVAAGGAGVAGDVLCFVVETVDDLAEVGGAQ
jgi:hypothetical protein